MRTKIFLLALLTAVIGFSACGGDDDTKSSENKIETFTTSYDGGTQNWTINHGDGTNGTITTSITKTGNTKNLVPTIKLVDANATINPTSGTEKDFTNAVGYTVTAQDGSTRQYTATVTWNQ